jgi:hypothetical protein
MHGGLVDALLGPQRDCVAAVETLIEAAQRPEP